MENLSSQAGISYCDFLHDELIAVTGKSSLYVERGTIENFLLDFNCLTIVSEKAVRNELYLKTLVKLQLSSLPVAEDGPAIQYQCEESQHQQVFPYITQRATVQVEHTQRLGKVGKWIRCGYQLRP